MRNELCKAQNKFLSFNFEKNVGTKPMTRKKYSYRFFVSSFADSVYDFESAPKHKRVCEFMGLNESVKMVVIKSDSYIN